MVRGECGCWAMAAVVAMVMMVRRYHRRSLYSVPVAPIPPVRCAPPIRSGPLGGVPLTTTCAQQPLPDAATPHPLYQVRTVGCGRCTPKIGAASRASHSVGPLAAGSPPRLIYSVLADVRGENGAARVGAPSASLTGQWSSGHPAF